MNAAAIKRFSVIAAESRRSVWPAEVSVSGAMHRVSKSTTVNARMPAEHGVGYIQRATATFLFLSTNAYVPDLGSEWELASSEIASEVGTNWRCFKVTHGSAGTEHTAVCYRLD